MRAISTSAADSRHGQGALGALIAEGETVRYELDAVLGARGRLTFSYVTNARSDGGEKKPRIEAGYLWTVSDIAFAHDLANGVTVLFLVPGYGHFASVVANPEAPHALGGGLVSFGAIYGVPAGPYSPIGAEGGRHEIRFRAAPLPVPARGRHRGSDIRMIRENECTVSVNPFLRYHPDPSAR